jgi:hypothetical protein
VAAVGVDGADDVDGVEDAGEVAEDGEQDANPELHGAAAMAEADAEGREQDGAQELQAPAAARAQAHLGSDIRILARCSARLLCEFGEGEWLAISSLRAEGTRIFLHNNKENSVQAYRLQAGEVHE